MYKTMSFCGWTDLVDEELVPEPTAGDFKVHALTGYQEILISGERAFILPITQLGLKEFYESTPYFRSSVS